MPNPADRVLDVVHMPVDLDYLNTIVTENLPEGFRTEYKRELGDGMRVLDAVSAMANTFGGIILVGIDEDRNRTDAGGFGAPGPDGLIGVPPKDRTRLAAFCASRLVPPFDPEINSVELGNGQVVLVVRVDPDVVPRPLMTNGRILVRTEAGNRPADYFRLGSLFDEQRSGGSPELSITNARAIQHPAFHEDPPADLVMRFSGIARIATSHSRPLLGDDARKGLRDALRSSKLTQALGAIHAYSSGPSGGISYWDELGINLSRRLDVRYRGLHSDGLVTPEARCVVELPAIGTPRNVQVTLDVLIRRPDSILRRDAIRLDFADIYRLFDALLETFATTLKSALSIAVPAGVGPLSGPFVGVALHPNRVVGDVLAIRPPLYIAPGVVNPTLTGEMSVPLGADMTDPDQRDLQARQLLQELLLDSRFVGVDDFVRRA